MNDNVVAVATSDQPKGAPAVKGDGQHHAEKSSGDMPLENYEMENAKDYVYDAFSVGEKPTDLPDDVNSKLNSISNYVKDIMKKEGIDATTKGYKRALELVRKDLGIDNEASFENQLDRMYGFIDATKMLKSLKYIDDEGILEKVKKQKTSKEMIDSVMKIFERYL